ncbi:integrin beta-PS-like isoform X2 [Tigriopus californicus]|uniref:integrin beta-PS-like isoform X2 n=1 Tax=Tigriopus californicus TaxID=6832 RepID=UPI0027DA49D7|nr:integrin beta-PS-like isoform X2 [Tigriopus californicus]
MRGLLLAISTLTVLISPGYGQFPGSPVSDYRSGLFVQNPCVSKQTCSECLQTPTCAWCMKEDYTSLDGAPLPRCNQETHFSAQSSSRVQCPIDEVVNPNNVFRVIQNIDLQRASQYHEAVQVQPQHVSLKMRVNEAHNLDFFYEQAQDYPVDLYYLMDLSKSMEDDKEKLSKLGDLLAATMQNITSNFKLGFGSFVDKVVMPYVSTVPKKLIEPCDQCAAPYGYQHQMPLTEDPWTFAGEVKRAQVSGNLDAPEGGFDAIMQAIVCKNEIGWRDKARKLLVFSTDAGFHYAGDGKLGGIVKPNDGFCHLDSKGTYTHSTLQDYPSVSQINHKVKENSVNVIFAVTEEQFDVYNMLQANIEGSSAGTLSADSSNIVELVKAQYQAITSSIEMKDNATGSVRVTYYSSCVGDGPVRQTNKCSGLRVGSRVQFTAKIEVVKCPKDPREWRQKFQIYPVGINESVLVDLEMMCQCECEQPGNPGYMENAPQCSGHGTYMCGICQCPTDFFGRRCECDRENLGFHGDLEAGCRPDNTTTTLCNNRGDCICGKCECYPRENPDEFPMFYRYQYDPNFEIIVSGDYCECDNFSCDRYDGLLCSGPEHGECVCGKCVCNSEYDVPGYSACECRATNETCITPYGEHINKLCSGHGSCSCGECKCFETEEGQFSGRFCEECPTCPGKCEELTPCVQCLQFQSGTLADKEDEFGVDLCDKCPFDVIEVEKAEDYVRDDERLCTFIDDDDCRATFVYGYHNSTGQLMVWVQTTKECPVVVDVMGIILGVIGAIVAVGLLLILMWKVFTTIHDRREFARFEKERAMAKWDAGENPIFKSATSTYKNPTYNGKM